MKAKLDVMSGSAEISVGGKGGLVALSASNLKRMTSCRWWVRIEGLCVASRVEGLAKILITSYRFRTVNFTA